MIINTRDDVEEYKKYILAQISSYIELSGLGSSTKFVAITSVHFNASKLNPTAGKLIGIEQFIKNKHVYTLNTDDNLCVFYCVAYAKDPETFSKRNLKGVEKVFTMARREYELFYGTKYNNDYQGFNVATESRALAEKNRVNLSYYELNGVKYQEHSNYIVNPEYPSVNILLFSARNQEGKQVSHAMIIKDLLQLTGIQICHKCKNHSLSKRQKQHYYNSQKKFNEHVTKCTGKFVPQVSLKPLSLPYVPHIQKHRLYEYLVANKLTHLFKPIRNYITFDFETAYKPIGEDYGKSSTLNATLHPISVAYTVHINGKSTTKSFFKEQNQTEKDFIENWMDNMFNDAPKVRDANLVEDTPFELQTTEVSVIGFNSARFDLNLIVQYLDKITFMIGSASNYKQINVTRDPITLRFIDMSNFIAGGTLDQFTQNFGDAAVRTKGYFPYEAFTTENMY
jgi:hypothetical protein